MLCFLPHKLSLLLCQLVSADSPRVCVCDADDLVVEGIGELFLDCGETATPGRMCNNADLVKAGVLDVAVPNVACVDIHTLAEGDLFFALWVNAHVGVHDEHWNAEVSAKVNEGQH